MGPRASIKLSRFDLIPQDHTSSSEVGLQANNGIEGLANSQKDYFIENIPLPTSVFSSDFSFAAFGFPSGSLPAPILTVGPSAKPEPVEVMVQFKSGIDYADQSAEVSRLGGGIVRILHEANGNGGDLVLVKFPTVEAASAAVTALAHNPVVTFAETNSTIAVQEVNDPYYANGSMWGMYGDQTSPHANSYGSQAGEAWSAGFTGSTKTVVGLIDTGMDYTIRDLYLNVWVNQKEIPLSLRSSLVDTDGDLLITFRDLNARANLGFVRETNGNSLIDAGDMLSDPRWENGIDEDGNGFKDDLIGWDFANNDNDPMDDNHHGTHVAGTIGAMGNDSAGVAGVNWEVQIMPLKFLTAAGSGSIADAILAVDYYTHAAAVAGTSANFVATNNSWGGSSFSQAMLDAITRGAQQDVLFIAAAGNGGADGIGDNNDSIANFPSQYSTLTSAGYEAVVAVAAITSNGALASFSNYGATTVDIGAPGQSIMSDIGGGGYLTYSGTSMAAPHVTGAVALLASDIPDLTAAEIRMALLNSAVATTSLNGRTVTGGRLDIPAMLNLAALGDLYAPTVTSLSPADGATGVAIGSNLVMTFSEAVRLGSGTISIAAAGGAVFETYDVTGSTANLSLAGNVLTIDPSTSFLAGTSYVVTIEAGAVRDLSGNLYAGTDGYGFITVTSMRLTGTSGGDTLIGDDANDTLNGLSGIDKLDGRGSDDLYLVASSTEHPAAEISDTGTFGFDELRFTASSGMLKLFAGDLGLEAVTLGTGTAEVANISGTGKLDINAAALGNGLTITGNEGANAVTGTVYADTIIGNGGKDSILAGAGNDVIRGGLGRDTLTGGSGADVFVFDTSPFARTNTDAVTDFATGTDKLHFSLAVFAASGLSAGTLQSNQFWASPKATSGHDIDDRFIYNTKSGVLYFDPDGSGSLSAVEVLTLGSEYPHTSLMFSDLLLI